MDLEKEEFETKNKATKNSLLQFRIIYLPNPYGTSLSNLYEFYIINYNNKKKRKCVVQSVKP